MIETYFVAMTEARFMLASLNMPMVDGEMIHLCLAQFILNEEMNEPCEKWEDSTVAPTFVNFRTHMIQQMIRIEGRQGTLATANIANLVEASTNQATEILSGELLVQAEEIRQLKAALEQNSAAPGNGIPSLIGTDESSVMSSQLQAMKVKLDSLKAATTASSTAATTAAATAAAKAKKDDKRKNKNDNDMPATVLCSFKQRSI